MILCATYRNHERRCDSPAAPGLLATIGFRDATGDDSEPPLRIFGPRGIKALVRTALCLSDTRLTLRFWSARHRCRTVTASQPPGRCDRPHAPGSRRYQICEIADEGQPPTPPTAYSAAIFQGVNGLAFPPGPMELESQTLRPEGGVWRLHEDSNAVVSCSAIRHRDGIPTLGFAIEEKARPGKLDPEVIKRVPKNLLPKIGCLKEGNDLLLPDGTCILAKEAVGPPIRGRKLAVLGDTCDPWAMLQLAQGCDVLIHEATNAKLEGDDETLEQVRFRAFDRRLRASRRTNSLQPKPVEKPKPVPSCR